MIRRFVLFSPNGTIRYDILCWCVSFSTPVCIFSDLCYTMGFKYFNRQGEKLFNHHQFQFFLFVLLLASNVPVSPGIEYDLVYISLVFYSTIHESSNNTEHLCVIDGVVFLLPVSLLFFFLHPQNLTLFVSKHEIIQRKTIFRHFEREKKHEKRMIASMFRSNVIPAWNNFSRTIYIILLNILSFLYLFSLSLPLSVWSLAVSKLLEHKKKQKKRKKRIFISYAIHMDYVVEIFNLCKCSKNYI